jgi:hypothetical protein
MISTNDLNFPTLFPVVGRLRNDEEKIERSYDNGS